jgi:hypothetical protein
LIQGKQAHLMHLRQDVFLQKKKIKQQLQNSILQKRILKFQNKIEKRDLF